MKNKKYIIKAIASSLFMLQIQTVLADEMKDLVNTIVQASPKEAAKAHSYKKKSQNGPSLNDLKIPESQLLEASSKFPKDLKGKYVYGPVYYRRVDMDMTEPNIVFAASNGRLFHLFTRDQKLIEYFAAQPQGEIFEISKKNPVKLIRKEGLASYYIRMPYDNDPNQHTFGDEIKGILQQEGLKLEQKLRAGSAPEEQQ